jgi:hypothetical protein
VSKFKVGFDIDDVLMPWYARAHEACKEAGLTGGVEPTTWRPFEEYPDCTQEQWLEALDVVTLKGTLYLETAPDEDAVRALRSLYFEGHEVHLITARGFIGHSRLISQHTVRWLELNAIPYKTLSFTQAKGPKAKQLGLDWFIDDNEKNWREVGEAINPCWAEPRSFLLDRPWNQNVNTFPRVRVRSVQEYVDIITKEANRE